MLFTTIALCLAVGSLTVLAIYNNNRYQKAKLQIQELKKEKESDKRYIQHLKDMKSILTNDSIWLSDLFKTGHDESEEHGREFGFANQILGDILIGLGLTTKRDHWHFYSGWTGSGSVYDPRYKDFMVQPEEIPQLLEEVVKGFNTKCYELRKEIEKSKAEKAKIDKKVKEIQDALVFLNEQTPDQG